MIEGLDLCIRSTETINKGMGGRDMPLYYLKKCKTALEVATVALEEAYASDDATEMRNIISNALEALK